VASTNQVVAFAKKNQALTVVGVGAAILTAYFAFRQVTGPSQSAGGLTPAPAPSPTPAPVGGGLGADTGGGGASSGVDLSALAGLLASAQSSGGDQGTALGQAGLQAGVDLGSAGLQTGADLGMAGLQVGSNLGLGGLQLASDVTGYLGTALETSVGAQAYQTLGVTDSLTKFLGGLVPKGSLLPPAARRLPIKRSNGGSSGIVRPTGRGTRQRSSLATKPGTTTPVGHRVIPAPKPVARRPIKITRTKTGTVARKR
jgi:hypothetical protein